MEPTGGREPVVSIKIGRWSWSVLGKCHAISHVAAHVNLSIGEHVGEFSTDKSAIGWLSPENRGFEGPENNKLKKCTVRLVR